MLKFLFLLIGLTQAIYSEPIDYPTDGPGYIGPSFSFGEYTDETKLNIPGLKIILRKETNTLWASADSSAIFGIIGEGGEDFPIYSLWPVFTDIEKITIINKESLYITIIDSDMMWWELKNGYWKQLK